MLRSMGKEFKERTLRRRGGQELVVEKGERPLKVAAVVPLIGSTLGNERSRCQLRQFRRRSLGERSAEFQDAAHNIFVVLALTRRGQVVRSERRRSVAEEQESGTKGGLQGRDAVAIDFAAERLSVLTR